MKTPDVADAAWAARQDGTLLGLIDFLCRTRFTISPRIVKEQAAKLGVPVRPVSSIVFEALEEAVNLDLCEQISPRIYRSKVTGVKP